MDALDSVLNAAQNKRKHDISISQKVTSVRTEIYKRKVKDKLNRDETEAEMSKKRKTMNFVLDGELPEKFHPILKNRIYACGRTNLFLHCRTLKMYGIRTIFWLEAFPHPEWEMTRAKEWWPDMDIQYIPVTLPEGKAYPTKDFPEEVGFLLNDAIDEHVNKIMKERGSKIGSEEEKELRNNLLTENAILLVDATASMVVDTLGICIAMENVALFPEVRLFRHCPNLTGYFWEKTKEAIAQDWYQELCETTFVYPADKKYMKDVLGRRRRL
jgi:hypothetical protein